VNEVKKEEGNVRGFATVVFGNSFKITNIAIVENKEKGQLFVSMPRYKSSERDESGATVYKDVCNPITAEFREELYANILEEFERVKEQGQLERGRDGKMKQEIYEVKEDMKAKASEIITEYKKKGKEALNKVSEFFGVKKKLEKIRDKVREGIVETDITLARIDGFTEGVHVANQQIANSFRVLAGKDQKDYSQQNFRVDNSMLRKPWAWQKKVYQNLELHLDAAIDKVENLSLDVRNQNYEKVKKAADRDESKVEKAKEQMDSYTPIMISPIIGVAEGEHKYGSDAFEEFMAKQGDKDKAPIDISPVKKDGKRR
jgi:DNA-binding cell septation regulator SpoVG